MNLSELQDILTQRLIDWLGLSPEWATLVAALSGVIVIVLVAGIVDRIVSGIIGWLVPKIAARPGSETPRKWETAMENKG